jgi:hypothetical protein
VEFFPNAVQCPIGCHVPVFEQHAQQYFFVGAQLYGAGSSDGFEGCADRRRVALDPNIEASLSSSAPSCFCSKLGEQHLACVPTDRLGPIGTLTVTRLRRSGMARAQWRAERPLCPHPRGAHALMSETTGAGHSTDPKILVASRSPARASSNSVVIPNRQRPETECDRVGGGRPD